MIDPTQANKFFVEMPFQIADEVTKNAFTKLLHDFRCMPDNEADNILRATDPDLIIDLPVKSDDEFNSVFLLGQKTSSYGKVLWFELHGKQYFWTDKYSENLVKSIALAIYGLKW